MSSSIYQGLPSCLEPRLLEPRVLRLNLTPSKSNSPQPTAHDSNLSITTAGGMTNDGGSESGGWSFLQALSSASGNDDGIEKGVYIHPLTKQSSLKLSEKSLEMCTESLGNETGSDESEIDADDNMALFPTDGKKARESKKLPKPRGSFPPPLTIGIKVKPHREGGRLILKAVSSPSVKSCFQVERGGGRLRLLLLEHCFSANSEEEEAEGEMGEEMEENNVSSEGEMGIGNRLRPSRCKDGGRGRKDLRNWEPFCVTT